MSVCLCVSLFVYNSETGASIASKSCGLLHGPPGIRCYFAFLRPL